MEQAQELNYNDSNGSLFDTLVCSVGKSCMNVYSSDPSNNNNNNHNISLNTSHNTSFKCISQASGMDCSVL